MAKKITLKVSDEAHARLLALAKRPGGSAAFERALASVDDDPANERLTPGEKADLFAMMARAPGLEEGAQDEEEEELIEREAERALNDEIAEEEMGEAEREEHERKKGNGRPNPLTNPLKRWASGRR